MTPAQTSTRTSGKVRSVEASKAPHCEHTLLTKPECHCPTCLAEQIAMHSPSDR